MTEPTSSPSSDHQHLDDHLAVRLLQRRTLVLSGELTDHRAGSLCQALLLLAAEDPRGDVRLLVHSPGGSVAGALAVADTAHLVPYDVRTVVLGTAHGAAQLLASAGTPGARLALPHATLRADTDSGPGEVVGAVEAVARGLLDGVVDSSDALVDAARQPVGLAARR